MTFAELTTQCDECGTVMSPVLLGYTMKTGATGAHMLLQCLCCGYSPPTKGQWISQKNNPDLLAHAVPFNQRLYDGGNNFDA